MNCPGGIALELHLGPVANARSFASAVARIAGSHQADFQPRAAARTRVRMLWGEPRAAEARCTLSQGKEVFGIRRFKCSLRKRGVPVARGNCQTLPILRVAAIVARCSPD